VSARGRGRRAIVTAVVVVLGAAAAALAATLPHAAARPRPAAASVLLGLRAGPAPWAPEYAHLADRLAALRLPAASDTAYHVHVRLRVFVDGRVVPVPAGLGIDPRGRFLAPLHTHDASGIVHLESERAFPFTLGEVFAVWGVRFGPGRLGGYTGHGARRLRVYVDGRRAADPGTVVLHAHQHIVVGFGRPGQAPTTDATPFPPVSDAQAVRTTTPATAAATATAPAARSTSRRMRRRRRATPNAHSRAVAPSPNRWSSCPMASYYSL
jgi:hypothetical protein